MVNSELIVINGKNHKVGDYPVRLESLVYTKRNGLLMTQV